MRLIELYLVLLKGTMTSFAGLASLPVIHDALVAHRHLLSEQQLAEAVAITRSTPGPVGLYVVSVGYFVAGVPGAVAGWLAMNTPALLIIPMLRFSIRWIDRPRVRSALELVMIASAGLLLAAAIPLARTSLSNPVTIAIAWIALVLLVARKVDVLIVIVAAAIASAGAAALGVLGAFP